MCVGVCAWVSVSVPLCVSVCTYSVQVTGMKTLQKVSNVLVA